jgi:hypothetical protein
MGEKKVSSSSSSSGIGFAGLLTVAFVVLKLTGYIDWSWWWVLSPVIVSGISVLVAVFVVFVLVAIRNKSPF